jgi:hypothetical protein
MTALGTPNLFVLLDEAICQMKIRLITGSFKTQRDKDWFIPDAFLSLLQICGVEPRAPGKYAEALYCRRAVL